MQKRSRESLFLMICTQTSCVMICHYSVMDKKMTAILYKNYSHFLVRTTGLVGRETSVIAIVAQYAPIASAAQVQVANIVCRQLKNCRKSVAVTKKDEQSRLLLVRTTGLEPAPSKRKQEPESCASANSAMSALRCYFRLYEHLCQFYVPKIEHYFA